MSDQFPYSFGKYRMEAEIGRGGFGTVFRAQDVNLDRPVAIKIMDPVYMRDQRWVARFRREARLMAKLDHPHIVPIHEISEEEGRLYLAMKFIDGPDLTKMITQQGGLPWDMVVDMTGQIASALDYAHQQNVIHRDLKPGNILVSNGQAMLTDFGLASMVEDNSVSISMTGGIAGTYNYMSPEVFNNEDVTPAADVYALGCVLYEMLAGHMLVEGKSTAAIIGAHLKGVTIDEPLPEGTPPGTRELIQTALAKDPLDRYPSAAELAQELQRISLDRLTTPYAQLERAVAGQDWSEALSLAIDIRAQDPNYRDVVALEARAQQGHWSERWRTEAQRALADNDFDAARGSLSQWRRIDPANPESESLEQELALAEQYVALQALVSDAQWEAAQTAADAIYTQDPSFRDIAVLQATIVTNLTPRQPPDEASDEPYRVESDATDDQATAVEPALALTSAATASEPPIDTTAEPAGRSLEADQLQAKAPAGDQPDPLLSTNNLEQPTGGRFVTIAENPIVLTTAVWAFSTGILLAPVFGYILDHGFRKHFIISPTEVTLRLMIFGFIAGLGTALVLWKNNRSLRWPYVLSMAAAWSLALLLVLSLFAPIVSFAYSEGSFLFLSSVQLMVAGILAGSWMVFVLRRNGIRSSPKQMAFIIAGWGAALFAWNLLIFLPEYLARYGLINTPLAFNLMLLLTGAVAGAIGSMVMYRQLKDHLRNSTRAIRN
jgi:serine/threonine protein kinase